MVDSEMKRNSCCHDSLQNACRIKQLQPLLSGREKDWGIDIKISDESQKSDLWNISEIRNFSVTR